MFRKKSTLRFASSVFGLLAIAGCASLDETVPPAATLVSRGKSTPQLESGRQVYLQHCTRCHVAATVRDYPASDWPRILSEMAVKAKLTPGESQAVLAYVLAASK